MATFTTEQLTRAVDLLVEDLRERAVPVRIQIVGGAAIALRYDDRRVSTRDVDVLGAQPEDVVVASVERLADQHGWPRDWLNTKVRMFQPDPDHPEPAWVVIREVDSVVVEVGTPQLLLAMKLYAARGRRDFDDIAVLIEACGVTTVQEAEALFEAHYSAELLKPKALALLNELLR